MLEEFLKGIKVNLVRNKEIWKFLGVWANELRKSLSVLEEDTPAVSKISRQ